MKRYSPEVVQMSIDEGRIDLTGSERLFGPAPEIAHRILKDIKTELGLPASGGLANSGIAAKIAAELAKPAGLAVILPGYEKPFLSPLKVERIPGIGKKSLPRFHRSGIHRIGDISILSKPDLSRLFGRWAVSLSKIADGQTRRFRSTKPVSPSRSNERTFSEDITDHSIIRREIRRLVENLGFRLRRSGLRARTVGVKIRDGRFHTITRSITLDRPVNSDHIIFDAAVRLVSKNLPRGVGIRLLGVSAQNLTSGTYQLDLFEQKETKNDVFYNAVDQIKHRFGRNAVHFSTPKSQRFRKAVYTLDQTNEEYPQ